MTARIDRLWPDPAEQLSDEAILDAYAFPTHADLPWLRMNFISSIDGAATRDGLSGGLGDAADRRVFDLLRVPAHAVLVAAGTIRDEQYGAMRLGDAAVAWRDARGLPPQPVFATVTRSLDLDPASDVFAKAPVPPIVYTVASAPASRRARLERVARVVDAGEHEVDLAFVKHDLAARGCPHVHSEGGPTLFGATIAAGVVDELCLTLAPTLEAGEARRISHAAEAAPTDMGLASILRSSDELLLRYVRASDAEARG